MKTCWFVVNRQWEHSWMLIIIIIPDRVFIVSSLQIGCQELIIHVIRKYGRGRETSCSMHQLLRWMLQRLTVILVGASSKPLFMLYWPFLVLLCNLFTLTLCWNEWTTYLTRQRCFFYQALAVVNMLAGLCGATYGFIMGDWIWVAFRHGLSCTVLVRGHYLFLYQSALILCCISLDRCLMVKLPLRYPSLVTQKRAKIGLFVILLLSLCPMVPLLPIDRIPARQILQGAMCGESFPNPRIWSRLGWDVVLHHCRTADWELPPPMVCMMRAALRHQKRVEPTPSPSPSPSPSPLIAPRRATTPSSTCTDNTTLTVESSITIQHSPRETNEAKPTKCLRI